jgi:hypothetical protein
MRKDIQARQAQMRQRQQERQPAARVPTLPPVVWNPVDYSKPVEYSSDVQPLMYFPRFNGVYLLNEGLQFYIGQSMDVHARFSSHRVKPVCCEFADPRGVLLATVPETVDGLWADSARIRLNAEARFIAAALSLGVPLNNTLSVQKRAKLAAMFPDLGPERARIEAALKLLR